MNERELQAHLDRLTRQFGSNEPVEVRSYLATALESEIKIAGSSASVIATTYVSPLEVIDLEELEMLEAIQELGGPTLAELLEGKASSALANAGLRDYVLLGLRLNIGPSARVRSLVERLMDHLAAKEDEPPDAEDGTGVRV